MLILYRLALCLLPAPLRRKHAAAMETLFARELEHARARGFLHVMYVSVAGIGDVLQRSAYELTRMKNNRMETTDMSLPTTKQLLRRHAMSFSVSFISLTALLLFQFTSRQYSSLSARGFSSSMILQALLLSLPFVAAMTIPMSVLVSVLYEFTKLGANGTLAMARQIHNGIRRMIAPVLVAATGLTLLAFVVTAEIVPRTNERLASVLAGHTVAPGDRSMTITELRAAARKSSVSNTPADLSQASDYEIEIQKKFALPAACLVLALAGMALAFSVPTGGVPLAVVGSIVFLSVYYALIMTGEVLADRQAVTPFVAMWGANGVMLSGAYLLWRLRISMRLINHK